MSMTMFIGGEAAPPPTSYLFDTYAGAAGYSLRQLKTGVTNCIRVRRSSDNVEQDIGFVDGFLDTASLASFLTIRDGFVTTWYDQSGNGYNLTQSTASLQPLIYTSSAVTSSNGHPGIYFNSDELQRTALSFMNDGNNLSYYTVTSATGANTGNCVFSTTDTATPRISHFCDRRTAIKRNLFIVTNTPSPGTLVAADMSTFRDVSTDRYLSGFITSSKGISSFDNGATGGTNTYAGTYGNDLFSVGVQLSSSFYMVGYIKEILLYSSDNSSDRTSIEADIAGYYGL